MPFVLTGTIVPNAVPTVHGDVRQRRDEYERAIRHYLDFGPVYFVENSTYAVERDPFFTSTPGLQVLRYPPSCASERGKGYQEFEMLDAFVRDRLRDDAFIKVTGRYVYRNIEALATYAGRALPRGEIVIDLLWRKKMAVVGLWAVTRSFYVRHLMGANGDMDDRRGEWAEHVLYRRIHQARVGVFWCPAPVLQAVMGSTGWVIEMPAQGLRPKLRNLKRALFAALGGRELLF